MGETNASRLRRETPTVCASCFMPGNPSTAMAYRLQRWLPKTTLSHRQRTSLCHLTLNSHLGGSVLGLKSFRNIDEANLTRSQSVAQAIRRDLMSKVFVIDSKKSPLDPIHPAQARQLLRNKKASIFRRFPLTLILKEARPESPVSPLRLKIYCTPIHKTDGYSYAM